MPFIRERTSPLLFVANTLAGGIACSAPLFVGAVHPSVTAVAFIGAMLAMLLAIGARIRSNRRFYVHFLGVPLWIGCGLTFLSLVPMPAFIRVFLDKEAVEMVSFMTEGLAPAAKTLMREVLHADPPEGAFALLRLCTAALLFAVITDGARSQEVRKLHLNIAWVCGLLVMLVASVHSLFLVGKVYGLYAVSPRTPVFGPLLNPNHLARVLGFFSLLGCMGFLQLKTKEERFRMGLMGLFCGVGVPLTLSRGAVLSFLVVLIFLGLFLKFNQLSNVENEEKKRLKWLLGLSIVGACVVFWATAPDWSIELESTLQKNNAKIPIWQVSGQLLQAHPWGVGNGGLTATLPAMFENPQQFGFASITHAENSVLSTLTAYGYFFGILLIVVTVVITVFLLRDAHRNGLKLALPSLAFLFIAELFGFALDLSFGLWLAAWALGLLAGELIGQKGAAWKLSVSKRWLYFLVLSILGIFAVFPTVYETRYTLIKNLRSMQGASPEVLKPLFEKSLALHPHEGWFAFGVALQEKRLHHVDKEAYWLRRTLVAHPDMHDAHLAYARLLQKIGKTEQALIEYRLALRYPYKFFDEIVMITQDVDLLLYTFRDVPRLLQRACDRLLEEGKDLNEVQRCMDTLVETQPQLPNISLRAAQLSFRRKDFKGALQRLEEANLVKNPKSASLVLKLIAHRQGEDVARSQAKSWEKDKAMQAYPLYEWLFFDALRRKNLADAHRALQKMKRTINKSELYHANKYEVNLLLQEEDFGMAMRSLQKAMRQWPQKQWFFLEMVKLQLRLRLHAEAVQTFHRAEKLGHTRELQKLQKIVFAKDNEEASIQ